jgi:TolA-binding protein
MRGLSTALFYLLPILARAAPPPAPQPPPSLEEPARAPQEDKLREEIIRAIEVYERESKAFKREVQSLIEQKYKERRNALGESYEKAIRDLEVQERKERLDAIGQFEEFLRHYPNDLKYTPDVMFRLAELYYERSSDDHVLAMREYEEKLKESGADKQPPPEPSVDFSKSIAIYRQLLSQFPSYRLNDASYYLLGYCLEKQNQVEEGQQAYHQLIARYPKSKFATEAWVRIGEYRFEAYNTPQMLAKAAEAYEAAIKDTDHPLYDKALYKLGWTYYRMDRFEDAVSRFTALVDYYDAKKGTKPEEGGGDLRNEALQYTAISFADEKWGSLAKAKEFFQRLGGRPYEAEIYKRIGDVYFDQTKHLEAIQAYRLVLEKDPLSKDAPAIQEQIVQAYERDRKLDEAAKESQVLAEMFKPGSPWFEKYKRDPELVANVQGLAEKNLYSSAVYHHQQALLYKQEKKVQPAKASFEAAAKAYASYLSRFENSKNTYEVQFYLAECLYNSDQFKEAGNQYALVRDSGLNNKYFKEAAFAAVLSWQKEVELEVQQKKIPELKPLRSNERKENQPTAPIPLADAEKQQVAASDTFVLKLKAEPQAPGIAYKAAELYYAHNDFPEARRRFEEIIKSYPGSEVAKFATNLTVESFLSDKDWQSVEDVSAKLAENKAVIDPKSELYRDLVKFKLAGRFKLADQLMEKGEYEAAARKYIALVDEEPHHEFADKALNNAAVAYEKERRFDSALKLYERVFKEYPNSKLADSALFRVAVNAENSYDFDKAVSRYQQLVREYPASKNREASLFNAARLLEAQQRYPEAAAAFSRYAELFPKNEDAPKNAFRAALNYEKQGDWKSEVKTLERFVKSYGVAPNQVELAIDAHNRIGDAQRKLGHDKEAKLAYAKAGSEFDRRNMAVDAFPIAAEAAAQSRFQLAEYQLAAFDRLKIGGRGKKLERSFADKRAAVKKVNDAYAEVFKYKRLEWTLAALYRRGYALERFGTTIIETPVPPDVKRLGSDAVVAYQELLGQQTVALEDKAVESYATTLAEARKNHITNEWTKKTLESLNRFRPQEYPLLKDPKGAFSNEILYPTDLVDLGGGLKQKPSSAGLGKEGPG